jgi:toxin YhaV
VIIGSVENACKKDPKGYKKKRAAKLLAAVLKVAFEDIPSDPTRDIYRQGGTLGEEYKHWFRAKFLQQFGLFFRYQQTEGAKIIVLAWVNDGSTLRAYENANDAYAGVRKMMKRGKPSLGPLRQLLNSRKARRAGGNAGQSTRYFPQISRRPAS